MAGSAITRALVIAVLTQPLMGAAPTPPRVVTSARGDRDSISGERDDGGELSRFMRSR